MKQAPRARNDIMSLRIHFFLVAFALVGLGCAEDPVEAPGTHAVPPTVTLRQLQHGSFLGHCVEPAVRTSDSLAMTIARDLALIEETYGSKNPLITEIVMSPPWGLGLIVEFDATTFSEVTDSTYHDWDSLNAMYGLEVMTPLPLPFTEVGLRFDGTINLCMIIPEYKRLRGVMNAYLPSPVLTPIGAVSLIKLGGASCPILNRSARDLRTPH